MKAQATSDAVKVIRMRRESARERMSWSNYKDYFKGALCAEMSAYVPTSELRGSLYSHSRPAENLRGKIDPSVSLLDMTYALIAGTLTHRPVQAPIRDWSTRGGIAHRLARAQTRKGVSETCTNLF